MKSFSSNGIALALVLCFALASGQECVGMRRRHGDERSRQKKLFENENFLFKREQKNFKNRRKFFGIKNQEKQIEELVKTNPLVLAFLINSICRSLVNQIKKQACNTMVKVNTPFILGMILKGVSGEPLPGDKYIGTDCKPVPSMVGLNVLCRMYNKYSTPEGRTWREYQGITDCSSCYERLDFLSGAVKKCSTSVLYDDSGFAQNKTMCFVESEGCCEKALLHTLVGALATMGVVLCGTCIYKGVKFLVLRYKSVNKKKKENVTPEEGPADKIVAGNVVNVMSQYS
ncbi:hypothetical protein KKA53_02565 [Candidatus Dependentiae bacterium]|nr:hypothetical protein [Candidatus Dependentiae bacterium]